MIVEPLLNGYERLLHLPDLDRRVCRPSSHGDENGVIDPMDMIRVLAIKGDEKLTNETILATARTASGRDGTIARGGRYSS